MTLSALLHFPLDGRYHAKSMLCATISANTTDRYRVLIEIEWLKALSNEAASRTATALPATVAHLVQIAHSSPRMMLRRSRPSSAAPTMSEGHRILAAREARRIRKRPGRWNSSISPALGRHQQSHHALMLNHSRSEVMLPR